MATTYTITDQRPVMDPSAAGGFVPAMEITFTTKPNAVAGRVRVPMSQYSAENVDRIVGAQVATIEAVQQL